MTVQILETVAALRAWRAAQKESGRRVALVPTMGALHDGHLELVRQGLKRADMVVTSIFVNPSQFGPSEDFTAYPRTWHADLEKLAAAGGQAVFHPAAAEMYPPGFATTVSVAGLTDDLEGAIRPGHFAGVATVVTKLLAQTLPDIALFGEKDFQQLAVIRRLAADLDLPVDITGVLIVRDADGLALSSRNVYLSDAQRVIAARLNKILFELADRAGREESFESLERQGRDSLLAQGFDAVDYLTFRDVATLSMPDDKTNAIRLLAVARLGSVRLLDNVPVTLPPPHGKVGA